MRSAAPRVCVGVCLVASLCFAQSPVASGDEAEIGREVAIPRHLDGRAKHLRGAHNDVIKSFPNQRSLHICAGIPHCIQCSTNRKFCSCGGRSENSRRFCRYTNAYEREFGGPTRHGLRRLDERVDARKRKQDFLLMPESAYKLREKTYPYR